MEEITYSVVIPVYGNEGSIERLVSAMEAFSSSLSRQYEVVFVIDGSPDNSLSKLKALLPKAGFQSQILIHSRNFGSFAAIRSGLRAAQGRYMAVLAADLQEPPELIIRFFEALSKGECDVAIGTRAKRDDPLLSKLMSKTFWGFYSKYIVKGMPQGGVDIFGCNRDFRDELLKLKESRSSLVALIFWLGFTHKAFPYNRVMRQEGKSGWSFKKKVDYMFDSIFSFTDFPVRLLLRIGFFGTSLAIIGALVVFLAWLLDWTTISGYTPLMLTVLFLGGLNMFSTGIVGTYAWRAYENSKQRPLSIVMRKETFQGNKSTLLEN